MEIAIPTLSYRDTVTSINKVAITMENFLTEELAEENFARTKKAVLKEVDKTPNCVAMRPARIGLLELSVG